VIVMVQAASSVCLERRSAGVLPDVRLRPARCRGWAVTSAIRRPSGVAWGPTAVLAAGVGADAGAGQAEHGGEADQVGVDAGQRCGAGGEGSDHVVYQQECPGFLAGQFRGLAAQGAAGPRALLAARAAAGGGRGEPGQVPAVGPVAGEDRSRAPGPGCSGVPVRQSSRQQILEHPESARLQYALTERAAALGCARSQIVVIDDDLGVSAATADAMAGFARLVTEVTMGRVGIVLGIEMSRLARTGRDWHQLLELCSLSGVLLADPDGVYDPGFYNDRLLPERDDERRSCT